MTIFGFSFAYPVFFLLFFCIIGVYFLPKKGIQISTFQDLVLIYKTNVWYVKVLEIFLICMFCFYVILLAAPYKTDIDKRVKKNGIDVVIAFDVSFSMEASDISPSRIELAKKLSQEFISGLGSDRVGMILFAGRPFTAVPLTFDYNFLTSFISKISTQTIDQTRTFLQGTAIGDALIVAKHQLIDVEEKLPEDVKTQREKIVILITDGEANAGINPLSAVKLLKEHGIKVYTIGIGGEKDTQIVTHDAFGRTQTLKIGGVDEKTLKSISTTTGGEYFRGNSTQSMTHIFETLEKLLKTELQIEQKVSVVYNFQLLSFLIAFFGFGVLCIFILKKLRF